LEDRLFVYYGGADMVVCVATAKMDEFMLQLSYEHEPVPLQVNFPVNPLNVAVNPVKVSVKTQEHIYGYCMKCRSKAEIKNPHHVTMKNRRHAVQGICPRCGTKMFRFRRS
jgi:Zn finger protein HypA/HybF involved in hydrogenase expression